MTVPRWCFAIGAKRDTIYGVWILPSWQCLADLGHATSIKVRTPQCITVIWDILNHEHDILGEILVGSATLW